jgi:hypothetical protein
MDCRRSQNGFALLLALLVLSILSAIGAYLALESTTEVQISDNFESWIQSREAALAGFNHGRALLRGLPLDALLQGPDGTYSSEPSYLAAASTGRFRNPMVWGTAKIVDILHPELLLSGSPDDGQISTGRHLSGNGTILIPATGIALVSPDPYRAGSWTTGRYFVKITDNNGEPGELAGDPSDNPFHDGDALIILRSMGIARTFGDATASGLRRNSVAVFEGRFKRLATFDLDAPLVLHSDSVDPISADVFGGNSFLIQGSGSRPGIETLDPLPLDAILPANQLKSRLSADQQSCILGAGEAPSIVDSTAEIAAHGEKRQLLDPLFMCRFLNEMLPRFSDVVFSGNQNWSGGASAALGNYDPVLPQTSPTQDPKVALVRGDLAIEGDLRGGGLLVVTGRLTVNGNFSYSGLVLVVGSGEFDLGGAASITGGVYLAALSCASSAWGTAKLSIRDSARLLWNQDAIRMALSLIPPAQLSFREITSATDP